MRLSSAVLIVSFIASLDLVASAKKEIQEPSVLNAQMTNMEDTLSRGNATVTTSSTGDSSENMTTNSTSSTNQTTTPEPTGTTVPTSMTNSSEKANVTTVTTSMAPMTTTLTPEVTTKGNNSAVVITSLSAVSLCVISLIIAS